MARKITLIGAGSVVFAKTLLCDILQRPELADVHLCLMDIDSRRLKVAEAMARRVIAKLGVPATLEVTTDRRRAIRQARYVLCAIQVGGYKPSTLRDFDIPKKYGLRQTIGDTLGIGGVFRGLRTIPKLVEIARDIAEVGHPDCLFINYSNPMCMNSWAVEAATGVPYVGLCHSVFGTARMLASHVGLPFEEVSYLVAGINHMAFFLKFEYQGQDAYPLLWRVLEDPQRTFEKVRYEMMRRTGYFVTESSEHQSEYVPYFIPHGEKIIHEFQIPLDEYLRRCEIITATWKDTEARLLGSRGGDIEIPPPSHEYAAEILLARETGRPHTVYGNVPNRGAIANLPPECCVEVPCLVDGTGLHPVQIGSLPPQLAALCLSNIHVQRLTVEAALTGKREHIYHAVMHDPHTAATLTLDRIWALCDELLLAHQKDGMLGAFSPVMKNSGRAFAGLGDRILARLEPTGPFVNEAGKKSSLRLVVENPGPLPASIALELRPGEGLSVVGHRKPLRLHLPAGGASTTSLQVLCLDAEPQVKQLHLASASPNVLAIGARLVARRCLKASSAGEFPLALSLHGFPAAEGFLRVDDEAVLLHLQVADSDPTPSPASTPWLGSCLELFFAQPQSGVKTSQWFLAPQGKGRLRIMDAALSVRSGLRAACKVTRSGYTLEVRFPRGVLGLGNGDFLFDLYASLHALGDAHSGGRTSLSGTFVSHEHTAAYLLVSTQS